MKKIFLMAYFLSLKEKLIFNVRGQRITNKKEKKPIRSLYSAMIKACFSLKMHLLNY